MLVAGAHSLTHTLTPERRFLPSICLLSFGPLGLFVTRVVVGRQILLDFFNQ